jgi:hypothetical protein
MAYSVKTHNDFRQYCIDNPVKLYRKPEYNKVYESVFIEFRPLLHIQHIIYNCINKLNVNWSHTIVCGKFNHENIKKIVGNKKIKVIVFEQNVNTVNDYNNMLLSIPFWKQFHGEKLLIYQEDSYIFNTNISDFLKYDYVGAPWVKDIFGGNGGFSLRTKSIMIECLTKHEPPKDTSFTRFDKQAEDLYFCKTMYTYNIGKLAPRKVGVLFSQEQLIPPVVPFGGHKFWDARDNYDFMDLPYKISPSIDLEKTNIPRNFIQTFRDNHVHKAVVNNSNGILRRNKGFTYMLFDDSMGIDCIKKHFDERTLEAFKKLKAGAAKGDFIRYIVMYIYGGMYLDMDAYITTDMSEFLNYDFVFIYDNSYNISQWFFMVSQKHYILKCVIDEMVERIHNNEQNIFLATGPTLVSDVVFGLLTDTKIYNSNKINIESKKEILKSNSHFMNGLFTLEDSKYIIFTFPGYNKEMLYDKNNPRYVPVFNAAKSPDLYN